MRQLFILFMLGIHKLYFFKSNDIASANVYGIEVMYSSGMASDAAETTVPIVLASLTEYVTHSANITH